LNLSLARIQWAGFEAAEVALPAGGLELPSVDLLREALARNELDLSAIDAGPLEFGSAAQALDSAARIGRGAVLAHALDGPRVVCRVAEGTLEHLAYGLVQLAAAMPGYPVAVCPVNADSGLLAAPEDFEELRERVERQGMAERLGLALDPAAASAAGWDPEEFARAAEVPLRYVYLTDRRDRQRVLPGAGELDWEQLTGALRADSYEGYLSLVLPDTDPLHAESDAKEARGFAEAFIYSAH
jgi:sugar phosphate isomerase/epimerase